MPTNLQRLTTSVSAILAALECPVCLDTIPPPAHQCSNGHLICVRCRVRAERCPVCRVRFCRGRSLLADRVFTSLTDAFGLGVEPEERRAAGLRTKLFGGRPPLKETSPETKVTPPKNKFLARVLGKSCSVENLSPHRGQPSPHDDDEDFASLKAKSLSTGEIFRPNSPAPVSRSTSINSSHRVGSGLLNVSGLVGSKRPASYHGSCESFDVELADEVEDPPCFCPCDADCAVVVPASCVLQHVRETHEGPLVQYFRPKVSLSLPSPMEDTALISLADGRRAFFLKIAQQATASSDTLVWLWYLGPASGAQGHQLRLTLKGHGAQGKVLHFRADALSLAAHSWADVVTSRRGVCLPAQVLIDNFATELESGIAITMEVKVKAVTDL
ncbi:hypothetical protein PR048_016799 [Dryococelus australis]|uniref:RING-type domain-containing protein n=1 Tax=Dryococelus australis TaxID=614101 RepID=A0ABQ9H7U2_9NEOP|nr:hypothetical protein PR048_016799 [Dryococelus australis]